MRDLFGEAGPNRPAPARRPRKPAKPPSKASLVTAVTRGAQPPERALDSVMVESFCALGAAVCLESPAGLMWLVPSYTDEARPEISAADFVKVAMARASFPGSRIASFTPHTDMTLGASPEPFISAARRSK